MVLDQIDELLLLVNVQLAVDVLDVGAGRALGDMQIAGDDGKRAPVG